MRNQTITQNRHLPSGYVVRYWDETLGKVVEIPCDERGQAINKRRELIAQGYQQEGIAVSNVAEGRLIDE